MASLRLAVVAALTLSSPSTSKCCNPPDQKTGACPGKLAPGGYGEPVAAPGWNYRLAAKGLRKPRSLAFDSVGRLLVLDAGVGVLGMTLGEEGEGITACVTLTKPSVVVEGSELNHGLALSADGKTLFASSPSSVFAWHYDADSGTVRGPRRTVVANMSSPGDQTSTRTLVASRTKSGTLIVSRGVTLDDDPASRDKSSGHSQIRAFDVGGDDTTHDFRNGTVLGWGLRNAVGVAEDPVQGGIWSVENSVDELTRAGLDAHSDNPGDELNYHGRLDNPGQDQGGNYGFPQCFAVWNASSLPERGSLRTGDQFAGTETASDDKCRQDFVAPRLAFAAHSSPLDIKFDSSGSSAFVSFHGSWNRDNPIGFRIAAVAFDSATGEPRSPRDSSNAAIDVLSVPNLADCPERCFRPVGLALDGSGRLWFSSDSTGEIFALHHDGSAASDAGPKLVPRRRAAVLSAVVAAVLFI
ncbi:hypothetical protein L249_8505 [Ophiocordyceps polyrhachis-furcata BCC 54312]|uniref:Pyrroloquinoline quinone-dependent pyranose dehydrogenase beta-propeller domain-containing protein n=1 Tax=Ophiocordyceps polyrhachis-furcata BCC 54312 TaxID=1330021 RepID=A0A367L6L6_9HYPO|nr:hypothetical protein L249_8505 [Ophiocordyceps polyrhachis-furcata BCC 54312]